MLAGALWARLALWYRWGQRAGLGLRAISMCLGRLPGACVKEGAEARWGQHGVGRGRKRPVHPRKVYCRFCVCALPRLPGDSCIGLSYRHIRRVGAQPEKVQVWILHHEEVRWASDVHIFVCTNSVLSSAKGLPASSVRWPDPWRPHGRVLMAPAWFCSASWFLPSGYLWTNNILGWEVLFRDDNFDQTSFQMGPFILNFVRINFLR